MTVLASFASNDDGSLNQTKAAYVIDKYKYKGVHTMTEKYQVVMEFVQNPSEMSLYKLLSIFNETGGGGFDSLKYVLGVLVEGQLPPYLIDRFDKILSDPRYTVNLFKISVALLKTEEQEDFILYMITHLM